MLRHSNPIHVLLLILVSSTSVMADEVLTVAADSTLAGHAGYVLTSTNTEDSGGSIFIFEEAGKARFYAIRDYGVQSWDILSTPQYVVPTGAMSIGDTWTFIETDFGEATLARVTAQENVTTPAGFFTCFRVDIERLVEPGVVIETLWFSWGAGFVRNQGYLDTFLDWRDELQSSSILGGTGYLPMAVGNTWNYVELPVAAENTSWGGLKSIYR